MFCKQHNWIRQPCVKRKCCSHTVHSPCLLAYGVLWPQLSGHKTSIHQLQDEYNRNKLPFMIQHVKKLRNTTVSYNLPQLPICLCLSSIADQEIKIIVLSATQVCFEYQFCGSNNALSVACISLTLDGGQWVRCLNARTIVRSSVKRTTRNFRAPLPTSCIW